MIDTTLSSLLERAAHETTPLPEAVAALQAIKRRLAAQGKSISDLVVGHPGVEPAPYKPMFSRGVRTELEELRAKNRSLGQELLAARREVAQLHRKLEAARGSRRLPRSEDGSMAWEPFSMAASAKLKRAHGWRRIFARQLGLRDEGIMLSWAKRDCVPPEAVAFLDKLRPEAKRARPARQAWTRYEYGRLAELLKQGQAETEIAPILEAEFGRTITLGSVKKARQRIRLGQQDRYAANFTGPEDLPSGNTDAAPLATGYPQRS